MHTHQFLLKLVDFCWNWPDLPHGGYYSPTTAQSLIFWTTEILYDTPPLSLLFPPNIPCMVVILP